MAFFLPQIAQDLTLSRIAITQTEIAASDCFFSAVDSDPTEPLFVNYVVLNPGDEKNPY